MDEEEPGLDSRPDDADGSAMLLEDLPSRRPLRIYTLDPLARTGLNTAAVVSVPYEPLKPGPSGARIEVVDFDGHRRCFYEPIDLDNPVVALQSGLAPDERDPRFHQQMTYAVAMSVLDRFDQALGRRVQFRKGPLRLFPHAFRWANAYYDAKNRSVLFGYFTAPQRHGQNVPGQKVFTCLSHDIIAHEVTHALVHRLRPRYMDVTNNDVRAFHEAMSDIVAVFLHFQLEGVLERAIETTRTTLGDPSPLVDLAAQFGYARGSDTALRTALRNPDPDALSGSFQAHSRGAILLAAVFGAFLDVYRQRVAELTALATGGTGILAPGNLDPRLVTEVAAAARQTADRILVLCIRAFDYLPPVDVTFGDFLRAVVTADFELFPGDRTGVRTALIHSCYRHGILPEGVYSLAEGSLRWDEVHRGAFPPMPVPPMRLLADAASLTSASPVRHGTEPAGNWAPLLTEWAVQNRIGLGLGPGRVLVRHFHTSFRVDEFRQPRVDAIVQVLQRAQESEKEHGERLQGAQLWGGATIVADAGGKVRYVISKPTPGSGDRGKKRLDSFLRFAESSSEYDIVPAGQKKTRLSLDLGALHMASGGHDR